MAGKFRIVIIGGGHYKDRAAVFEALTMICRDRKIKPTSAHIIVGAKPNGADLFARDWCKTHGASCETVSAPIAKSGEAAFSIRNNILIRGQPDLVMAFPGDRWTLDCLSRAEKAGIERVIIRRPH